MCQASYLPASVLCLYSRHHKRWVLSAALSLTLHCSGMGADKERAHDKGGNAATSRAGEQESTRDSLCGFFEACGQRKKQLRICIKCFLCFKHTQVSPNLSCSV